MAQPEGAPGALELRPGRGILGTGRHLVWSRPQPTGERRGTIWLTVLYIPVVPLRSVRARPGGKIPPAGSGRLEILGGETPSGHETLSTLGVGLLCWALAWSPLAFALYWLKRGSLLAPSLYGLGKASWIQALAGATESFEGALRLLVGAWLPLLAAAITDQRRPRITFHSSRRD